MQSRPVRQHGLRGAHHQVLARRAGTPPAAGPGDVELHARWPRFDRQRVVRRVDRDGQRLELVEPVGAGPEHAQGERELGRGQELDRHAAARVMAAHASRSSASARACGSTPAASSTAERAVAELGLQGPAEHLAALAEPGPYQAEQRVGRRDVHRGNLVAHDAHQRRLDLRWRHEHGRGDQADEPGPPVVRDLHGDRAVVAPARRRGEALSDLALHHEQQGADHRCVFEEPGDDRRGHVVRQVRDELPAARLLGEERVEIRGRARRLGRRGRRGIRRRPRRAQAARADRARAR